MEKYNVDILLATYNGEQYIQKQLESLIEQTYTNWKLLVRDDGSTDGTIRILEYYKEKLGNKMEFIEDGQKNLGAKNNFFELLKHSTSEFIFFCDQDDIWFKEKIEKTLEKFKSEKPTLVHTNTMLIDENDKIISRDFWKYSKISNKTKTLNKLLVQNNITGCTMAINKALKENVIYQKDENILMHDWWIGIVASFCGEIIIIDKPTMKYRQHSKNEVGAKNYKNICYLIKKIFDFRSIKKSIEDTKKQASIFFEIYSNESELKRYSQFSEQGQKIEKYIFLKKHKMWKYGIFRNILFYILF